MALRYRPHPFGFPCRYPWLATTLNYLPTFVKQLPTFPKIPAHVRLKYAIDGFKLSHGFTTSLSDERSQQVALGLLSIARGLKLPVVVEGIETPAQAKQLRSLGFVWGQGFLYRHIVLGPGPYGD